MTPTPQAELRLKKVHVCSPLKDGTLQFTLIKTSRNPYWRWWKFWVKREMVSEQLLNNTND